MIHNSCFELTLLCVNFFQLLGEWWATKRTKSKTSKTLVSCDSCKSWIGKKDRWHAVKNLKFERRHCLWNLFTSTFFCYYPSPQERDGCRRILDTYDSSYSSNYDPQIRHRLQEVGWGDTFMLQLKFSLIRIFSNHPACKRRETLWTF